MDDLREERLAVRLTNTRRLRNAADIREPDPSDVLTEEHRLDLALLRLVHVQRLAIEELHVANPRVERRHAHVHAPARTEPPRVVATDGKRSLEQVSDVNAGGHDTGHQRSFEHAARAMLVAVHRDRRSLRQGRCVCRAETRAELRCEIDVHQTGDAEAAE